MNTEIRTETTDKTLFLESFVDDSKEISNNFKEKERAREWRKTKEYKEWRARYVSSEKYKERREIYENSENRKQWKKTYQSTPEYKEKTNIRNRNRIERLWNEVLIFYGNRCECCGESNISFLTLDHINGGGSKERMGSTTTLQKAVDEKDKNKYRILCYNCNTGRYWNGGICPHIEEHHIKNSNRIKFIETYGNKCSCCGETIKMFLTLDHINGRTDGELKTPYKEAILNIDEKKYRVLCCNCNAGREHRSSNGICPHKQMDVN